MSENENRPVDEDRFVGGPIDDAPKIPPDFHCNSRSSDRIDDGPNEFSGYCSLRAGWGTDHVGEGRCRLHGGAIEGAGAPKSNQNSATHSLGADPHHYFQSLPDEEQAYVESVASSIEDRLRAQGGDLDYMDRVLARRISTELHIVSRATDYIREEGLIHEVKGNDRPQALLEEVRRRDRSIVEMLDELGVLDGDDDVDAWRELVEGE